MVIANERGLMILRHMESIIYCCFEPFELRMHYIGTTLPYYTGTGHSNLNPEADITSM